MYNAHKGFPVDCFIETPVKIADEGIPIFFETISEWIEAIIYKVPT